MERQSARQVGEARTVGGAAEKTDELAQRPAATNCDYGLHGPAWLLAVGRMLSVINPRPGRCRYRRSRERRDDLHDEYTAAEQRASSR